MTTKVLITGSSGFVGGHILSALVKDGRFDISLLLRDLSRLEYKKYGKVKVYKGDITMADSLIDALKGQEIIVHCAGLMSNYDDMPRRIFYEVNALGTRNLLASCDTKTLKQFIHISTAGVYGSAGGHPAAEDTPYGSKLSDYEWSKKEAEIALFGYASENNTPFTVLRPSQLYGPGMRYGWPETIRSIKYGKMLTPGPGSAKIHLLNIRDFTKAVILAAGNPAAIGKTYNIAGPAALSIKEIFGMIASILGVKPPKRIPYNATYALSICLTAVPRFLKNAKMRLLTPHRVKFFAEDHMYDISRAESELGYIPSVSLEDGLRQMIAWCEEGGML